MRPTQTQALDAGSAARGAIPAGSGCAGTDQRGIARPAGVACDIGAYQTASPVVSGESSVMSLKPVRRCRARSGTGRARGVRRVEYGTTTAYGSVTTVQALATTTAQTPVSAVLGGLLPGTIYHFRLVASNADGTTDGTDHTFTTAPAGSGGPGAGSPGRKPFKGLAIKRQTVRLDGTDGQLSRPAADRGSYAMRRQADAEDQDQGDREDKAPRQAAHHS